MFSATWALPRSRGVQRQRSILAMMVSITSLRAGAETALRLRSVARADHAVRVHLVGLLVGLHRGGERLVVAQAGRVARHVEPLAQQRNAGVFRAGPQRRPFRNAHDLRLFAGRAAQLGELGLERAIARLRRAERVDRRGDVGRLRELGERGGHVRRLLRHLDLAAHAGKREAAGLQVAREGDQRRGQAQLGLGLRLGRRSRPSPGSCTRPGSGRRRSTHGCG